MICCKVMQGYLDRKCQQHPDPWDCTDYVVIEASDGRIGIPVRDGGTSIIVLDYCPWCGTALPHQVESGDTYRQLVMDGWEDDDPHRDIGGEG